MYGAGVELEPHYLFSFLQQYYEAGFITPISQTTTILEFKVTPLVNHD